MEISYKGERVLKGIPSSPGMAIGKAVVIQPELSSIAIETISSIDIPSEIEKFESALFELNKEFNFLLNKVSIESKNVYAVIEANVLLLNDSILIDSIKKRIQKGFSAESSIIHEFDYQKQFLFHSKDQMIRDRATEIDQIKERLLNVLRNKSISYVIGKNSIVVAQSLMPTDVLHFKEAGVAGIITEVGGISAHSSILARSFDIPEIIGVKDATALIDEGSTVIMDGYTGIITLSPSSHTIADFKRKKSKELEQSKKLGELRKLDSVTLDGKKIKLMTNVNFEEDVTSTVMLGADGIGLVRTEHLVIKLGHFPSEDDQFKWYNEIAEQIYPSVVTFRAFDVGSDKYTEGMPKHEANPALGFRGIRFLLHRKDIFKTQLTAILKASKNKNVRLMLPMISTYNEYKATLELLDDCKFNLRQSNINFDEKLPIGIMIETPASALMSSVFAKHVQFFSIGTNDLTQYTLAADRTNELVSEFFDSFHPAVLKLIKMTVDSAKANNIHVGVCGEMAGHAAATALLIGLGVDELSVTPQFLLNLKSRVRSTKYEEANLLAEEVLQYSTYTEVRQKLGIAI